MNTVELFFAAICKDDYVCVIEHGPYISQEDAETMLSGNITGRCYPAVIKVTLPCEILR